MVIPREVIIDPVTTEPKGEVRLIKRTIRQPLLNKKQTMEFASYISGFTDGEGCFSISFNQRPKFKSGLEVRPSFSLSQNKRSLGILQRIQKYFRVGSIRYSKKDDSYKFEVRSIKDLTRVIIPHFKNYQLLSSKRRDFELFAGICELISANLHLKSKNLKLIIKLAYQMNGSGKRRYTKKELLKICSKVKI